MLSTVLALCIFVISTYCLFLRQLQQQVEADYRSLLNTANEGIWIIDTQGRTIYANQPLADMFGCTIEQMLQRPVVDFMVDEVRADEEQYLNRIQQGIQQHSISFCRPNGSVLSCLISTTPRLDRRGTLIGTLIMFADRSLCQRAQEELRQYRHHLEELVAARTAQLTRTIEQLNQEIVECKQAEEQLRSSEAYLAEAQKIAHIGSWELDVATQAITWSDEVFRIFGLDPEQPAPTYSEHLQQIHPDDREIWQNTVEVAIAQKTCYRFDFRILRPDDTIRFVNIRGKVKFNPEGQVTQLFGTLLDITERQEAEEALRESEEQLRLVFAQAPIGIALNTPDGQLQQVNQAFCQMLGYTEAQLIALNVAEISHPEDLIVELPYIEQCCQGEISSYQLEKRYLKQNGDVLLAHLTCAVIHDPQGQVICGIAMIQDVTERKQAEQELQRQIQYRQLLAEITFRIRESLQIEVILQTTVTELQQLLQADRVLFYRMLPDYNGKVVAEAVVTGWPSTLGRELVDYCFETEYLQQYKQEIHAWPDVEQAGFQPCHLALLRQFGIRADLIVPILLKDKLWGMLFVHQCSAPRSWSQFEIELLRQLADQLSIALAQAEMLEQETRHSQELARSNAELEQFAYVASHDLKEPLRTIASYAKLLSRRYSGQLDEKGNRFIQYIMEEALRMQALINDLLKYSRLGRQVQNFASCDTRVVYDIALKQLEEAIALNGATVTCGELPTVMADETQLVQLFQNLIGNAIKYRSEQPLVIRVAAQRQEGQWLFNVCDNGIGIDPRYTKRIFAIFQRLHTQEEYSGTGIGLAIASKIVERHSGRIWVESELGQGATFYFTIPDKGDNRVLNAEF